MRYELVLQSRHTSRYLVPFTVSSGPSLADRRTHTGMRLGVNLPPTVSIPVDDCDALSSLYGH